MDIEKIFQEQMTSVLSSGFVEKIIEENIKKAITKAVDDSLVSYGDFSKRLRDEIGESLKAVKLNLPEYNVFISELIQQKFSQVLREDAVKNLDDLVSNTIGGIKQQEKLSNFFDMLAKKILSTNKELKNDFIRVSTSEEEMAWGSTYLMATFSFPSNDFKNIKVFFHKKNEEDFYRIFLINTDNMNIISPKFLAHSSLKNEALAFFFGYYAAQTKFYFDCDFVNIYLRN